MAITILVEPALEPVTLTEAKTWLRLDHALEDELVTQLLRTARMRSESLTSRAFIIKTVQETTRANAKTGVIDLAVRPVQSVFEVARILPDGDTQTLPQTDYIVDLDASRILLGRNRLNTRYRVQYIAGYGDAASDVPAPLKSAILLQIAWLFEHRDEANMALPHVASSLLAPFARMRL